MSSSTDPKSTFTDTCAVVGALGLVAMAIALIPVTIMLNGWVLTKLWAWFMVTGFGVAPLRLSIAIGIAMMVTYLTHQNDGNYARKEGTKWWHSIVFVLLKPLVTLVFGYVVHVFV